MLTKAATKTTVHAIVSVLRPNTCSPDNIMKTWSLLLVLGLALSACSKAPSSETTTQAPRGFAPIHTNVEVFIENYARSDHRGAQAQPKFTGHSGSTYGCSIKNDNDGREYSVAIEYRGTEDGHDFYWVSYTIPSGPAANTVSQEIAYFDLENELWRDSQWRVGIRPQGY